MYSLKEAIQSLQNVLYAEQKGIVLLFEEQKGMLCSKEKDLMIKMAQRLYVGK
jgi:hypothetical protein